MVKSLNSTLMSAQDNYMPMGRPTIFTKELGDKICEELATGVSLRTVCKADEMPCIATVFSWMRTKPDFLAQYARAKEESTDAMAEEILDIADDGSNDYMEVTKGNKTYNIEDKEVTNRSRLRVDTRKWIMSKMKPKRYGDKLDMTTNGKDLPTPILGGYVPSNHSDQKDTGHDEKNPSGTGGNVSQ